MFKNKKGFTLVELLAVIVILAIILAIAIPSITNVINNSTKNAFESNAKMVLDAVRLKTLENASFDPTTINETNINTLLNISNTNYKDVSVTKINGETAVLIVGQNKWDNLVVTGTTKNLLVQEDLVLWLDAGDTRSYSGTGTTWYDLSGNGRNATIYGTNTWTSTNGGKFDFGNVGQTTQYISLPYQAAQATGNSYTLEFWMQPLGYNPGHFCSMANGSSDNYMIMITYGTYIQRYNSSGTIPYTDNEIMQLTLVRDNSTTATLYKNGANPVTITAVDLINAVANGGWILNQEQDSIGGTFDPAQNYRGAFMMVKLYNKALSANEVQQNFNTYRSRYGL